MTWTQLTPDERAETVRPFVMRQKVCPFTADELMRWAILTTLLAFNGNRTWTAKHLKLSIRTLRIHIAKYREAGFYIPGHTHA